MWPGIEHRQNVEEHTARFIRYGEAILSKVELAISRRKLLYRLKD